MKRLLIIIAAIFFISVICLYIFIPSTVNVSAASVAKATRNGTYRTITSKYEWEKWWNGGLEERTGDTTFNYDGYTYNLLASGNNSAVVTIRHLNADITGSITLLQYKTDSIKIIWQCSLKTTANPFKKINKYFEAVNLKKNLTHVLGCLKNFVEKDENIYGLKISETTVKDTFLITTKHVFEQQPTMNDVYGLINNLKVYAVKNNCRQVDAPMLNILQNNNQYRVMVALPVNKEISTQSPVSFVKMTNGNFIFTRVKGGLLSVQNALQQMQLYFDDYDKTSMAITFQYLVTDRIKETDTTKWITEIYAPVL